MRRWEIRGAGLEQLVLAEAEIPVPGAHEVLVRVRATSLNFRDLLMVDGRYRGRPGRSGLVPLSDGAGEVVAVGAEVLGDGRRETEDGRRETEDGRRETEDGRRETGDRRQETEDGRWGAGRDVASCAVGDRVAGCFFPAWRDGPWRGEYAQSALGGAVDGMLSEYVTLPATGVVQLPAGYSYEQGATLPCAAVTAWNALVTRGALRAGETVLVLGSGGVSTFALRMARALGAEVIATTSSEQKAGRLRALGARTVVNYVDEPEWDRAVLEATGGNGVDLVVEVGGAGTLERSIRALAHGGRIALVGVLAGAAQGANPFGLAMKNANMLGIYVGSHDHFAAMNRFLETHAITPDIDRVFAFDEAPAAYAHMKSGAHFGKVVIAL